MAIVDPRLPLPGQDQNKGLASDFNVLRKRLDELLRSILRSLNSVVNSTDNTSKTLTQTIQHFPGCLPVNLATTKALTVGTSYASYLGKATSDYKTIDVLFAAAGAVPTTVVWAEVAIAVGTPTLFGNTALTTVGFVNVAASVVANGTYKVTVPITGALNGQELWAVIGCQSPVALSVKAGLADFITAGHRQSAVARPSTMAAGTAFTLEAAGTASVWGGFQITS